MALVELNKLQIKSVLDKVIQYKPGDAKRCKEIAVNDLVGVEIELEGWVCAAKGRQQLGDWWVEHDEGSLVNGREFVLYPPRSGDELEMGIESFFTSGCKYTPSERASVHIHVDMLNDFSVGQFRSLACLTYVLEGAIYRIADENRKWASYSCPLTDMRVERFNGLLLANTAAAFKAALSGAYHEEKYYGFNAVSLVKHGTIEFRYFPCTRSKEDIYKWINLCLELKNAARHFPDPKELCALLQTPDAIKTFVRKWMPTSSEHVLMYIDAIDCAARGMCCNAILNDKNAVKPARYAQPNEAPSKSFNKMMAVVFAPLYEAEKLKRQHKAVEVDMVDLYNNMLRQAKQNNHRNYQENV